MSNVNFAPHPRSPTSVRKKYQQRLSLASEHRRRVVHGRAVLCRQTKLRGVERVAESADLHARRSERVSERQVRADGRRLRDAGAGVDDADELRDVLRRRRVQVVGRVLDRRLVAVCRRRHVHRRVALLDERIQLENQRLVQCERLRSVSLVDSLLSGAATVRGATVWLKLHRVPELPARPLQRRLCRQRSLRLRRRLERRALRSRRAGLLRTQRHALQGLRSRRVQRRRRRQRRLRL